MNLKCPYHSISSHVNPFTNPWDYLIHLKKCHIINQEIATTNQKYTQIIISSEYYFCQSCMCVFDNQMERNIHRDQCTSHNNKNLLRDVNEAVKLGRQGSQKIDQIIKFYEEMVQAPPQVQMQIEPQQIAIPKKPTDPRLHIPNIELNRIIQNQGLGVNKVNIELLSSTIKFSSATYTLFNILFDIKQLVQVYDHKITLESLKQFLGNYNLVFSKELLMASRVCEFMEDQLIELQVNTDIYMAKKQSMQTGDRIWLLINEYNEDFKDYFTQPWCIFCIQTNKTLPNNLIEEESNELKQLRIQVQQLVDANLGLQEQIKTLDTTTLDYDNYYRNKEQKSDKLEEELSRAKSKLIVAEQDYESRKQQYIQLSTEKLNKSKQQLISYFEHQTSKVLGIEIEDKLKLVDTLYKKRLDKESKIDLNEKEKLELEKSIEQSKVKITNLKQNYEIKKQQLRNNNSATQQQQIIEQELCIQCKSQSRCVVQQPCKHILFCEQCYLQRTASQKNMYCALSDLAQCTSGPLLNQYKVIRFT